VVAQITNRFGSRPTFMVGSVFYSASLLWMGLGPAGSVPSFYLSAVALGSTNSFTLQSVYTTLSEFITDDARRHAGHSNAGFYSSLFVAGEKIAFALGGTLLAGLLLSAFGFTPMATAQSASAITGIAVTFSIVPLICNALAIFLMYRSHVLTSSRNAIALEAQPEYD
jgi:GPH family glycoside/pentoside/hexuronide:cation symporter